MGDELSLQFDEMQAVVRLLSGLGDDLRAVPAVPAAHAGRSTGEVVRVVETATTAGAQVVGQLQEAADRLRGSLTLFRLVDLRAGDGLSRLARDLG